MQAQASSQDETALTGVTKQAQCGLKNDQLSYNFTDWFMESSFTHDVTYPQYILQHSDCDRSSRLKFVPLRFQYANGKRHSNTKSSNAVATSKSIDQRRIYSQDVFYMSSLCSLASRAAHGPTTPASRICLAFRKRYELNTPAIFQTHFHELAQCVGFGSFYV